jgi:hypothetical protein
VDDMSAVIETGNEAGIASTEIRTPDVMQRSAETIPLDGRLFGTVASAGAGSGVRFEYTEAEGLVHVRYSGGGVQLGYRVGTRSGNHLAFRFAELDVSGDSASGRVDARIELLGDGRVRLREIWAVDSRRGEGASIVEELR